MNLQAIKQRFGIIGNHPLLNRAIDIAAQVAPTDLSVLITGESGVGKEFFPQIIHQLSPRKHGHYIAINCGAIPEGTIDSELFGHEKGSFTDAKDARKGYFEMANDGTIFLDEVAELPLGTQVRLLRVLESGEYMKVGSSKVLKTHVRIVAATNVDIPEAIRRGRFREDLYYRLNAISIKVPPLRERKDDIELLFRKFAGDISEKYRMPPLQLTPDGKEVLLRYEWKGNIRQLKNIAEQISIVETQRALDAQTLNRYLPAPENQLPALFQDQVGHAGSGMSDREILYHVLFDMQRDVNDLKRVISDIIKGAPLHKDETEVEHPKVHNSLTPVSMPVSVPVPVSRVDPSSHPINDIHHEEINFEEGEVVEESLSIARKEVDLIRKALDKHRGRRRQAAEELGISERTLYRKIKEYDLNL